MARPFKREFPEAPVVGVGAVVIDREQVLLVQRGREPSKGKWSLPGGALELGESLTTGVAREVQEETGLLVEPVELIELIDRIVKQPDAEGGRIQYHYVIADFLCRVAGGQLQAGSDADAVRWITRDQWNTHNALQLDAVTIRVIEKAWQRSRQWQSPPPVNTSGK